jgi:hypothetical protein
VASALVLLLSPVHGFIVFIAIFAWYPLYLTVPVGTIDFNLSRIIISVIFVSLFLQTDLFKQFKFIWIDKLVILYFSCTLLAGVPTVPNLMAFLENRAGEFFDTILPYFAVRLIVTSRKKYLTLLKAILVIAVPLAIVGFYQCLTGNNPMGFLVKYNAWSATSQDWGYVPENRLGFFRATVSFDVSIMFGLFFAMLGPICAGLMHSINKNKEIYVLGIGLMAVGVLSSMSSGPLFAALLATIFLVFYRYRIYWKWGLCIIVFMCVIVEIVSNRHFYQVIDRFTFNSSTAWYRARLMEVAIFQNGMAGHWLTGFGFADPGWSAKIDMSSHTDMVNHYLLILCRYGLVGFVPFMAVIVSAWRRLFKGFWLLKDDSDSWLVWCLGGAMVGLFGAFFTVSLFGPPTTIFFMLLGLCGAIGSIVGNEI